MTTDFTIFRKIIDRISAFMDSIWFAVVLGLIELLSYYLGLDLIIILCVSFFLSFALLFKKNLSCLLPLFLFMSSMVSLKNSPGNVENQNGFYFSSLIYVPCIIAVAIPVCIVLYFAIFNLIKKKIDFNTLLISILILGVAFLANGLFCDSYIFLDFVFGFFMFFFFLLLFLAILPRITVDEKSLKTIARQIEIYSFVIIAELLVFYINFFIEGNKIDSRLIIFLGWGNRNTIGMLLSICFCFLFYLVKKEDDKKFKILAIVGFILTSIGIIMSFSRQVYLSVAALITFYLLYGIIKKKGNNRKKYIAFFSAWCVLGISFVATCFYLGYFSVLTKENINLISDGRISLWKEALTAFTECPIFGKGFYFLGGDPKVQLDNVMPLCCHNTILEILGACGIFGFLSYALYRIMTIKEIVKNFNNDKLCAICGLFMILFMSLLDIHIFDLLGTCIYIVLLCMCLSKNTSVQSETNFENINDKMR